jgi:hypothetical protein
MQTSVPGLHIVNSAHITNGALAVNSTFELGERAVRELLRSSSPVPKPATAGA